MQSGRPARRIVAIDEGVVPFNEEAVFTVLLDFPGYAHWWPKQYRFRVEYEAPENVGTRVRIWNGRLVSWLATLTAFGPSRIELAYSDGAWEGEARWTLRPVLAGTAVVFRVQIDPGNWWLRLLAWRSDLGKLHSKQMKGVFPALALRLQALGAQRLPEPTPPDGPPPLSTAS